MQNSKSKIQKLRYSGTPLSERGLQAAVGFGDRTRLACRRRRPAGGIVPTIWASRLVRQNGETKFAARRRKRHAGGVCSPVPTARPKINSGRSEIYSVKRRKRRAPLPAACKPVFAFLIFNF
jgi:hypothetical protein